ncbi:MAG: HEAT repeat domain-containing protein [Myxococcales bacterium]|nr:HEAT repeat domain-containing protein [Myxococcales bacterium]MCB9580337.1 HEAT repeat domain-containing protein [Polyangiaceae bacterium]
MKQRNLRHIVLGALAIGGATYLSSGVAAADTPINRAPVTGSYANLPADQIEELTTIKQLKAIDVGTTAPTEIWGLLEGAEKVECLDCIPQISKLMYDSHSRTREIAAWWLRRRMLGVFGPGQVYEQTLNTVTDQSKSEKSRAYAAEAIGEFLTYAGVPTLAQAAVNDPSPLVRKSAAHALGRINHQGPNGELGQAIGDPDEGVRLEALQSAVKVHVFTDVPAVVERVGDSSPLVRKRAAEVLGTMRAEDAVVSLIAITNPQNEPEPTVRAAAVAALGKIADPAAKDAVTAALQDPNGFVRDAATFASRRL